jgi:hypothetical protein
MSHHSSTRSQALPMHERLSSPLSPLAGRGVGGEGKNLTNSEACSVPDASAPHPQPLSQQAGRGGKTSAVLIVAFLILAALSGLSLAQPPDKKPLPEAEQGEGVSLTIYNQDFVVVRERRILDLPKGRGTVRFRDVAATIIPETVQFTPLGQPDAARVIEQSYEFDVVNADKLFDKYVDRDIALVTREGDTIKGKLLSFDNRHLTLQTAAGIDLVPRVGNVKDVQFSALPEGLLTRPTLVWLLDGKQAGKQLVKVVYAAAKMKWHVDYHVAVNQEANKIDLFGWVTVTNETGTSFNNANLKLMAGDLHVVAEARLPVLASGSAGGGAVSGLNPSVKEKLFAEYHLYELARKTTITDHATKQIDLLNIGAIPAIRKYETDSDEDRVAVLLEFKNSDQTAKGLGVPLPKGPIRVFQSGSDGIAEFVGQDAIDHTPKDEPVRVRLGYAFDLKLERKTLAERVTKEKHYLDQQVRLRNHKPDAVTVDVIEPVNGQRDVTIADNSHPFVRRDINTLVFTVTIPANGETVITYTLRYAKTEKR